MAKKVIKEKAIEEALWESANKLRGSVEPSEYKHVVLSLIFLKYAYLRMNLMWIRLCTNCRLFHLVRG